MNATELSPGTPQRTRGGDMPLLEMSFVVLGPRSGCHGPFSPPLAVCHRFRVPQPKACGLWLTVQLKVSWA